MQEPVRKIQDPASGLSSTAMILGILSIIMIVTGFSFIIGSMGIILALLSRGRGRFSTQAMTGLITSAIGVVGGILITLVAFFTIYSGNLDEAIDRLNSLYETYITQGTLNGSDIDRILDDSQEQQLSDSKTACVSFSVYSEEADV